MANIAFPPTPANDQTYSEGGRTWKYQTTGNRWLVVADTTGILTTADRSNDATMAANSATLVPSQQAVKTYVTNNLVTSGVTTINGLAGVVVIDTDDLSDAASTNKFVTAAQKTIIDGAGAKYVTERLVTTTTYSLVADDHDRSVTCSNAALVTVTVPTNAVLALPLGFRTMLFSAGAAGLTLSAAGITFRGTAPNTIISVNEGMFLEKVATNTWIVLGGTA